MKRWMVLFSALMLLMAACGGDDAASDDDTAGDGGATTTTLAASPTTSDDSSGEDPSDDGSQSDDMSADDADSDAGNDGGSSSSVSGLGEATVTINGETYFFGETGFPALRCDPDLFGVFFVFLQMVDADGNEILGGGSVDMVLLQPGTDPEELDQRNEARVNIEALDQEWIADEEDITERELEAGTSQVDSYTIDGNRVTGTATFYEENSYWASIGDPSNEVAVTQGTFEVTCAG